MRTASTKHQQRRTSAGERVLDSVGGGQGLPDGVRLGGLFDPEEAAAEEVAARVVASGCGPDVASVTKAVRGAGGTVSPKARVHEDGGAQQLSARLGAHGVTVGDDVYLGAAAKDPAQRVRLLAHELTHTGQADAGHDHADHADHAAPEPEHAPEPVARRLDKGMVPVQGPGIAGGADNRLSEADAAVARQSDAYVQQAAETGGILQGIATKAAGASQNKALLAAAGVAIGTGIANIVTGGLSEVVAKPIALAGGITAAVGEGMEKSALAKRVGGAGMSKAKQGVEAAKSNLGAAKSAASAGKDAFDASEAGEHVSALAAAPVASAAVAGVVGATAAAEIAALMPVLGGIGKIIQGVRLLSTATDYAGANGILDQMGELMTELNFVQGSKDALVGLAASVTSPELQGFLMGLAKEMGTLEQEIQGFAKKVQDVANRDEISASGKAKRYLGEKAAGLTPAFAALAPAPLHSVTVQPTRGRQGASASAPRSGP